MKLKEHLLKSGDRSIKVWLHFPDREGLHPAVIICHGIPGGIPNKDDKGYLPIARYLAENGFVSVVFNFSGCGDSTGNIDINRWENDLFRIFEYVAELPGIDNTDIHLVGFSAGGAIALELSATEKKHISSLMLMATPANFSEIIPDDAELLAKHFRSIGIIRDDCFPDDIDAWHKGFISFKPENIIRWLPDMLPVCIVHGDKDEVVPLLHAQKLFNAAHEPKKLLILQDAPHQLRKHEGIPELILDWLKNSRYW